MKYNYSNFEKAGMIFFGVLMFIFGGIVPVIIWSLIVIIIPLSVEKLREKKGLVPKSPGFYDAKSGKPLTESQWAKKMDELHDILDEDYDEKDDKKVTDFNSMDKESELDLPEIGNIHGDWISIIVKRYVKERIKYDDGIVKEILTPLCFRVEVNLKTGEAFFFGPNKRPYPISSEMLNKYRKLVDGD